MALGKSKFSIYVVPFLETERACTMTSHILIISLFITMCFCILKIWYHQYLIFYQRKCLKKMDMKILLCVFLTPLCQITRAGEFVLPLDSLHKKPYEVLVLGRVQGDIKEALRYARIFMVNVFF